MKLHIGCGPVYLIGYVNIDTDPQYMSYNCPTEIMVRNSTDYEHYYKRGFGVLLNDCVVSDLDHNMEEPLPFSDGSVDEVVMYQVLEHMPKYDVDRIVSDIFRVLSIGGKFLVSVPDIKETAKLLANSNTEEEEDWAIRLIHGTQKNKWSHHFCGYTPRTLKALLSKNGFSSFRDLPSINFYPVVHIEAIKEK